MIYNPRKFLQHAAAIWISFSSAIFIMMMLVEISSVFGGVATMCVIGFTMFSYAVIIHGIQTNEAFDGIRSPHNDGTRP